MHCDTCLLKMAKSYGMPKESLIDCLTCSGCVIILSQFSLKTSYDFFLIEYSFIPIACTLSKRQTQVQILIPQCDAANLNLFLVMLKKQIHFQLRLLRFHHALIRGINETRSDFTKTLDLVHRKIKKTLLLSVAGFLKDIVTIN